MRIPQYTSQISAPNAPQFNNTPKLVTDDLGTLVDSLEEVQKVKEKEAEEAKKTAFFQADTSIKMEMDKAKHDIIEKIRNGGSYANAEAEYQKAHTAAINKYAGAYDADKSGNTRARAIAEYNAAGMSDMMQIRDAVTSRRRSDTADSASLRLQQLDRDYSLADTEEKRKAIAFQASSTMASLSGTGIISAADGRARLTKFIQGAESNRIELFKQNHPNDPKAVLAEVENSKEILSVDSYIQKRGSALNDIAKIDTADSFIAYAQDPVNNKKPTQHSTDIFYDEKILKPFQNGEISLPEYEDGIVQTARISGMIPAPVESQIKSTLSFSPENMSQEYQETVMSSARVAAKMYDANPMVFTKDGVGLNKKDYITAKTILSRIDAGVPQSEAISQTLKMVSDDGFNDSYKDAIKEASKTNDLKSYVVDKLDIDDATWPIIQNKANDLYGMARASGASEDEAKASAVNFMSKQYGSFDGVPVKYPPQNVTNINDPIKWQELAQKEFNNFYDKEYPELVKGTTATKALGKPILAGDEQTKQELSHGINPSFVLHYQTDYGSVIPVYDKNGMKVRISATPKVDDAIRPVISSPIFGGIFVGPVSLGGYSKEDQAKLKKGIEIERKRRAGELK